MQAMVLRNLGPVDERTGPLSLEVRPDPVPGPGELLLRVSACGVCHTEIDEIEGRTPPPRLPIVLGHQIVGRVVADGGGEASPGTGSRVGVGWIYSTCGACAYCDRGLENLCPRFLATGRDADGGYAELMVAPAAFCYPIPDVFSDAEAAPLLCAGAIGYRSLRLAAVPRGGRLGLTGFGASGHLVLKMFRHQHPGSEVFVFARNERERAFALDLGAAWAGDTRDTPPALVDAIIDTTPVWAPVVAALRHLAPAGRLVVNAIRKEDVDRTALLEIDYPTHLWLEKEIKSVANVTRDDVKEFLILASRMGIRPEVEEFPLEDANRALGEVKRGGIRGAKVLRMG